VSSRKEIEMERRLAVVGAIALMGSAAACGGDNGSSGGTKDAGTPVVDTGIDVRMEAESTEDAPAADASAKLASIQTVWVILFENHDWTQIVGNANAPYMNSLLTMGAFAQQYYNPPFNHPSLPNYLWINAGDNLGIIDDNEPPFHTLATTDHLVDYLENKGITWKAYEESIDGTTCPMAETALYAPKHDPFVYFSDVNGNLSYSSPRCLQHVRPYTELATDIQSGKVPRYNFITPNLCNDMHDCSVSVGDSWLATNLPIIMGTPEYKSAGAVFVTWDEADDGDGPIGMIAMSPRARVGYSNAIHYDHSSLLKTLQEIFGVGPLLRHAADPQTNDLSDLFAGSAQ
jgi:phosphatidylinositol-3-phosphatase